VKQKFIRGDSSRGHGIFVGSNGKFFRAFLIEVLVIWIGVLTWIFMVPPIEPVEWKGESLAKVLEVQLAG
jgi:hypothetical protein